MIHLHTKFHRRSFSGSLVTAIKLKAKYKFHVAATLLFYVTQRS